MKNKPIILWFVCLVLTAPMGYADSIPTIDFVEQQGATPLNVVVSGFDMQTPDVFVGDAENAAVGTLQAGTFHTASADTGLTTAIAVLLEPGSNVISDVVELTFVVSGGEAQVVALFTSDNPLGVSVSPGFPALVENGKLQDLSGIFVNRLGQPVIIPAGLDIGVQSTVVPEPTTWLLFATALVGLVAYGRLRAPMDA